MRFAVRRPATRPASPRGHRPPGDALPVLWTGQPGGVRPASGVTGRARALLGPADAELPVLPPPPVTRERPVDETVDRLGETTERLLLGHLRDRRPTVTDFARRERRLPPGHTAGALTSRTR